MPKLPSAVHAGKPRGRRAIAALAAALVATSLGAVCALAQKWPERSITLIVPFAAGGASDVSSRIMADVMSKHLGQSVIIENAAGAGGATGSLRGKNAQPDGYTIGFGHMGTHAAAVATNPKLPYDPRTDYDYLGIHLVTPHIMIVRKDFPADTLQEFVAYARAKGKDLKMGHNGVGSLAHLTCLFFFQLAGVEPTYVVYRGFGQTINDILSGSIDGTCELIASAREHVIGGTVKGFGVAARERTPLLPDVPTSKEGGMPEFVMESWLGLYAPKGVPPPDPGQIARGGGGCARGSIGAEEIPRDRRQRPEERGSRRRPHARDHQERRRSLERGGEKGRRHGSEAVTCSVSAPALGSN